ncbi:hypothetical protein D9M71_487810 [compost metagenome]
MGADHRVGVELIEGRVDFQRRRVEAGIAYTRERELRGVLLAFQVAAEAAVEMHAQAGQVIAKDFRLLNAGRRQLVVVAGTERGLAMSNQIDSAHSRISADLKVSRGYEDHLGLSTKIHTFV